MGSEESRRQKQCGEVNPMVPDDEPTSSTVEPVPVVDDRQNSNDSDSGPAQPSCDKISPCVETAEVDESLESLIKVPEAEDASSSSSSAVASEGLGRTDSSGTDFKVVDGPADPDPLPLADNTLLEIFPIKDDDEKPIVTTSSKVNTDSEENGTSQYIESASVSSPKNHSDNEVNGTSEYAVVSTPKTHSDVDDTCGVKNTSNCLGETSVPSEEILNTESNSAKEVHLNIENLNSREEPNETEILHSEEGSAEEFDISISSGSPCRQVPTDTESVDSGDTHNELEPNEVNNNDLKPETYSAESEDVENIQLFEGPIGYGTDLDVDDSPSTKSIAYGCGICYCIVGYTRESFNRHQKNYHWISLQCKVCKKIFTTTKGYENHMTSHIRYPCLHCPKEFKHPLEVEDHQGQHFSNKLVRCERCGEEFYLLATLNQHHSFMGEQCIEIQKNVRRIQQQLESSVNEELVKCKKGSSSRTLKSEMVEHKKNYNNRDDTPKSTVETRKSKRIKYEF